MFCSVTDYGLDDRGLIAGRGTIILIPTTSRSGLGPTQPCTQWVPLYLRPQRETDHSLDSAAVIKNRWNLMSNPSATGTVLAFIPRMPSSNITWYLDVDVLFSTASPFSRQAPQTQQRQNCHQILCVHRDHKSLNSYRSLNYFEKSYTVSSSVSRTQFEINRNERTYWECYDTRVFPSLS
jgi:hypothetical protein